MTPSITLRKALADPLLMGHVLAGDSWATWRTLLYAGMGEELTDAERVVFKRITAREREPTERVSELEIIAGRRGGKTRSLAALATYLSALVDYKDVLIPGEKGVCLCLAQDQRIATKLLDFCEEDLRGSEILRQLVVGRSHDTLELKNNINIEVRPASFRKLRGPTYIAVIADELAFWFLDATYVNPDIEILAAARPGLITTHGLMVMASSPYAKKGVLFDTFRKLYGPEGSPNVLVAKGTTRDFNPTITAEEIDAELERDRPRNTAEYLAEFRSDLDPYVSLEIVEACVGEYYEKLPSGNCSYRCFVDPAGGSGEDSFTAAVAHRHSDQVIIDAVREIKPPFSPERAINEIAALAHSYNCHKVVGDKYGGGFPPELFNKAGLIYEAAPKSKSDLYIVLLPLLNSQRIVLPKHDRMVAQIVGLERRVSRSGKDSIDHATNAHDDIANAVAGAAEQAYSYNNYDTSFAGFNDPDGNDPDGARAFANMKMLQHVYRHS